MSQALKNLLTLLNLEKIEEGLFRGQSEDLGLRQVFGGQVVGCCYSKRQTDFLYDGLFPGTRSGFRTSKNNAVRASA